LRRACWLGGGQPALAEPEQAPPPSRLRGRGRSRQLGTGNDRGGSGRGQPLGSLGPNQFGCRLDTVRKPGHGSPRTATVAVGGNRVDESLGQQLPGKAPWAAPTARFEKRLSVDLEQDSLLHQRLHRFQITL